MPQIAASDSEKVFSDNEQPVQLISYSDSSLPEAMSGDEGLITTAEEVGLPDQQESRIAASSVEDSQNSIETETNKQTNRTVESSEIKYLPNVLSPKASDIQKGGHDEGQNTMRFDLSEKEAMDMEGKRVVSLGRNKSKQINSLSKKMINAIMLFSSS